MRKQALVIESAWHVCLRLVSVGLLLGFGQSSHGADSPAVDSAKQGGGPGDVALSHAASADLAATQRRWQGELRPGKDVRPHYAEALSRPELGGWRKASGIESTCFMLAVRDNPRTGALRDLDVNAAWYPGLQRAREGLRTTCASLSEAERSPVNGYRRAMNPELARQDPLLLLERRASTVTSEAERKELLESVLNLGAPVNLDLLLSAMMRNRTGNAYFMLDGVRYPVAVAGENLLEGRSVQLVAAFRLASCDLGVDCGRDTVLVASTCVMRPIDCAEPSYAAMVHAELKASDYADHASAVKGVEKLRQRLVVAITTKDVAAFVERH